MTEPSPERTDEPTLAPLAVRSGVGGVLMGLANLVPGISGGTMLLAAGIYPRFISAIGEVTTLKFRKASLVVLGVVVCAAAAAVIGLAGPVKELVVHHRWIMYSIFIGLTLGGVPVVWRLVREAGGANSGVWNGLAVGFVMMVGLAVLQILGAGTADNEGFVFMLLAGIAGASAMILPGVSGGYLLLVLGVYVPILAAISGFKDALRGGDTDAVIAIGIAVILPVGLGVVIGIVGVSNLLKWLLQRYERPTLGALLGLLLGAVVGLFPFQEAFAPVPGQMLGDRQITTDNDGVISVVAEDFKGFKPVLVKGQAMTLSAGEQLVFVTDGEPVEAEDYPTRFYAPRAVDVAIALALILAGIAVTLGIDRFGREKKADLNDNEDQ